MCPAICGTFAFSVYKGRRKRAFATYRPDFHKCTRGDFILFRGGVLSKRELPFGTGGIPGKSSVLCRKADTFHNKNSGKKAEKLKFQKQIAGSSHTGESGKSPAVQSNHLTRLYLCVIMRKIEVEAHPVKSRCGITDPQSLATQKEPVPRREFAELPCRFSG